MSNFIVGKFTVEVADRIEISLPVGAKALHFNVQRGKLCLWAQIDTEETLFNVREFRMAGTGHPLGDANMRYMNTIMLEDGGLVFHFFEVSQ